jgi:hypothetical protein
MLAILLADRQVRLFVARELGFLLCKRLVTLLHVCIAFARCPLLNLLGFSFFTRVAHLPLSIRFLQAGNLCSGLLCLGLKFGSFSRFCASHFNSGRLANSLYFCSLSANCFCSFLLNPFALLSS